MQTRQLRKIMLRSLAKTLGFSKGFGSGFKVIPDEEGTEIHFCLPRENAVNSTSFKVIPDEEGTEM
jgi:hypothetical protein